ncbi:MAG: hypothetical protein Q8R96_12715 [Bacteroidota bacterium]|nr:hypothetical protein [Bacteroidota bacterium]
MYAGAGIVWFNSGSLSVSRWSQVKINSDNNCYCDVRTKGVRFDKASPKEWQASGKERNSIIEIRINCDQLKDHVLTSRK